MNIDGQKIKFVNNVVYLGVSISSDLCDDTDIARQARYLYCAAEVESRTQGSRPRPRTQKKIQGQGQGQPFRGQTLSRPRTGMLEAKAKDQGHKRKCSRKKKVFTKIFQAISKKKKGLHKNFSSDLHEKMFSKKFFKRSTKF